MEKPSVPISLFFETTVEVNLIYDKDKDMYYVECGILPGYRAGGETAIEAIEMCRDEIIRFMDKKLNPSVGTET